MHEAVDQRLVDIQDEVRDAFGWALDEDRVSAKALVQRTSEYVSAVPSWDEGGRRATLNALRVKLSAAERITILGAAATEEEARRAVQQEGLIIAADGSVGALQVRSRLACVVSDFDGGSHLHSAAEEGVPIVAHGHGDNIQRSALTLSQWSQFDTPPSLILTPSDTNAVSWRTQFRWLHRRRPSRMLRIGNGRESTEHRLSGLFTQHCGQVVGHHCPRREIEEVGLDVPHFENGRTS